MARQFTLIEIDRSTDLGDIITTLETVLPYMADNVLVRSSLDVQPDNEDQLVIYTGSYDTGEEGLWNSSSCRSRSGL